MLLLVLLHKYEGAFLGFYWPLSANKNNNENIYFPSSTGTSSNAVLDIDDCLSIY
jgi:hypothetical protein